jgi:hypothetical protein
MLVGGDVGRERRDKGEREGEAAADWSERAGKWVQPHSLITWLGHLQLSGQYSTFTQRIHSHH